LAQALSAPNHRVGARLAPEAAEIIHLHWPEVFRRDFINA
jgi:hypothetical protein